MSEMRRDRTLTKWSIHASRSRGARRCRVQGQQLLQCCRGEQANREGRGGLSRGAGGAPSAWDL